MPAKILRRIACVVIAVVLGGVPNAAADEDAQGGHARGDPHADGERGNPHEPGERGDPHAEEEPTPEPPQPREACDTSSSESTQVHIERDEERAGTPCASFAVHEGGVALGCRHGVEGLIVHGGCWVA